MTIAYEGEPLTDPNEGELITREKVDDQCIMTFEMSEALPIVHALDVQADMSELVLVSLRVPLHRIDFAPGKPVPAHILRNLRIYHPVLLWPSTFGWYRVVGLEDRYAEMFASAQAFDDARPDGPLH